MPLQPELAGRQTSPLTLFSEVVASPDAGPGQPWTDEDFRNAIPEAQPRPSRAPGLEVPRRIEDSWPATFVPPNIGAPPYDAMCKIFYRRSGIPYVASAWIVIGNTGRKGIITSGHVVYQNGTWSQDYVVCREYSQGVWIEELRGNFARTLNGWIHGQGMREFWDIGAVIPFAPVPDGTPALPVTFGYDPRRPPFDFFYDAGYPAKAANGYPFDGELLWESDGPLVMVHQSGDQYVLEAYNSMEQGSSGSPWLVYDALRGTHYVVGVQSSGWDNVPSSYSPYFDQRNIVPLLRDIGVLR